MSMYPSPGVMELMNCVQRLVESVQTEPLTQAEVMKRWQLTSVKTFERRCRELRLVPFTGRGSSAVYRLPAVLRAEERGEKFNGGLEA